MNYFISDLHFGHKNAIKFDNRPFLTVSDMNRCLINNWNKTISDNDDVYILGDVSFDNLSNTISIVEQLKGKLHLIKGNHDYYINKNEFKNLFVEICEYKELKLNNEGIVLCHYPILCYNKRHYGWYHLYGHIHNGRECDIIQCASSQLAKLHGLPNRMLNVGCMLSYMDYTPRNFEYLCGVLDKRR